MTVRSVVAILGARSLNEGRTADNRAVLVGPADELVAWLKEQPRTLDDVELDLVERAAEAPETWHIDPHAADTFRVMQRFERLVARVDAAPAPQFAPRAGSQRSTTRSVGSRPVSPRRTSAARRSSTPAAILALWAEIAVVLVALCIGVDVFGVPCSGTSTACLIPNIVFALKPLLGTAIFFGIVLGLIGTLRLLAGRRRR